MKKAYDIFIGLIAFLLALLVLVGGKSIASGFDDGLSMFAAYILTYGIVAALLSFSWKSITAKSGNTISHHDNDVLDDTDSAENINDTIDSTNQQLVNSEIHTLSTDKEKNKIDSVIDEVLESNRLKQGFKIVLKTAVILFILYFIAGFTEIMIANSQN